MNMEVCSIEKAIFWFPLMEEGSSYGCGNASRFLHDVTKTPSQFDVNVRGFFGVAGPSLATFDVQSGTT